MAFAEKTPDGKNCNSLRDEFVSRDFARTEAAVTHFVRSHLISMMFHSNNTRAWLALQSKDDKNVVKSGSPFTHWVKITSKYDMVIF